MTERFLRASNDAPLADLSAGAFLARTRWVDQVLQVRLAQEWWNVTRIERAENAYTALGNPIRNLYWVTRNPVTATRRVEA
jgi:hypothetical protein